MDRAEAYEILISEMEKVSETSLNSLESLVLKPVEIESISNSGKRYSISIAASKSNMNKFELKGSIHDNNTYKFQLVEEIMVVSK